MSTYTGESVIFGGLPPVVDEANPTHNLGQKLVTPDGRSFRYVRAGGTALVAGNLLQSIAEDTGEQDLTPTATAIGATTITTSAITVTANQYAGGYVLVTVTPGIGQAFKIKSHPASTAAAVTLTLEDPVQVALTTTSRIDLVPNIYEGVIAHPTTSSGVPVGVAVNDITANQYGWIQTGGIANVSNGNAFFFRNWRVKSAHWRSSRFRLCLNRYCCFREWRGQIEHRLTTKQLKVLWGK